MGFLIRKMEQGFYYIFDKSFIIYILSFSTTIEMMSQTRPPRRGGYSNHRQPGHGTRRGGHQQQQHHHSNRLRARDVEQALFTTTGRYVWLKFYLQKDNYCVLLVLFLIRISTGIRCFVVNELITSLTLYDWQKLQFMKSYTIKHVFDHVILFFRR